MADPELSEQLRPRGRRRPAVCLDDRRAVPRDGGCHPASPRGGRAGGRYGGSRDLRRGQGARRPRGLIVAVSDELFGATWHPAFDDATGPPCRPRQPWCSTALLPAERASSIGWTSDATSTAGSKAGVVLDADWLMDDSAATLRLEVFVRDLDRSVNFYDNALGFRVERRSAGATM